MRVVTGDAQVQAALRVIHGGGAGRAVERDPHGRAALIEEVAGKVEAGGTGEPAHPHEDVLLDARLFDQLLPVGVLARLIGRIPYRLQHRLRIAGEIRVGCRGLQHREVLVVVHQGWETVRALTGVAHACPEFRLHAARAGPLGRHQEDAVGAAAAVDRRRRRILQYVDGDDVIRVEVVEPAGDRHAVHDDERVVARGDGPHATNPDAGLVTGLVACIRDVHARKPVLHRLDRVGGRRLHKLVGGYRRDRTCHRALLLCAVTDDGDALQLDGPRFQREVQLDHLTRFHGGRRRRKAVADQRRDNRVRPGWHRRQCVPAVRTAHCGEPRPAHHHSGGRGRLTVAVFDDAGDLPGGLSLQRTCRRQGQNPEQSPWFHRAVLPEEQRCHWAARHKRARPGGRVPATRTARCLASGSNCRACCERVEMTATDLLAKPHP